MDYTFRPLSPDLAEVFCDFLDKLSFDHARHWSSCYCHYFQSRCSDEEWFHRTGAENRKDTIIDIQAGRMKGYLAFDGEKCIGWCNANDIRCYPRLTKEAEKYGKSFKTGCLVCFVIHQDYRHQGVARMLLKQAIDGFRSDGFDAVIAFPAFEVDNPEKRYTGTINMFLENGFKEIDRIGNINVMLLKMVR